MARNEAISEVKQEAVALGMAIAEKVIVAELDAKKHQRIVDEAIASYEQR